MPVTVQTVMDWLEELAPVSWADSWDNVGLQCGNPRAEVEKILIALDLTPEVCAEAVREGAGMIVTHHPFIFKPLATLRSDHPKGELCRQLMQNNIAVYAAHTNLDRAEPGVSSALAARLGLQAVRVLEPYCPAGEDGGSAAPARGLGRIGCLPESIRLEAFARRVKASLGLDAVRVSGDRAKLIRTAAVCGGRGAHLAGLAAAGGADVLVTGDVGYHDAQEAEACGIAIIDAGHAGTELPAVPALAAYLGARTAGAAGVVVSRVNHIPFWQG